MERRSGACLLDNLAGGEFAKSLLPEPEIGICEIAFLLGYSEPSAFHRFFRRWTGNTPVPTVVPPGRRKCRSGRVSVWCRLAGPRAADRTPTQGLPCVSSAISAANTPRR